MVAAAKAELMETKLRMVPEVHEVWHQRKRVLYVENSTEGLEIGSDAYFDLVNRKRYIYGALSQLFAIQMRIGLSPLTASYVEDSIRQGRGFDAMVTHVPPDYDLLDRGDMPTEPYQFLSAFYCDSLAILRQIKQTASGIFIVAYTSDLCGVEEKDRNMRRLFKEEGPLDELVAKTQDYAADYMRRLFKEEGPLDELVVKTDDYAADYRQIEAHLKTHFGMV